MENSEYISKGELKKSRVEEAVGRKRTKKFFWAGGILLLLGVLIYSGVAWSKRRAKNLPGQAVPSQGAEHVGTGHQHTYNSNPPTSGWHYPQPADWGIYKEELLDEVLIHNLEHGGIWISYKPNVPEELRKKLEGFYAEHGRKIIVTPRSKNDTDIALAAWTRLDKFNASEYSDKRVEKFIKAFRNKGPEFVP